MKLLTHLLFLISLVNSCGSSCQKDKTRYEEVEYEFEVPVSFTPGTDTVSVGQELLLSANFPDSLYDVLSKKKYHLPNFNFKTVAVFNKLADPDLTILQQPGSASNFSITNVTGALTNVSATFADVNYSYEAGRYKLQVKLVPKASGVYIIRFYHSTGSAGNTALPQELAPSEKNVKRFPLMRRMRFVFNDGNTHFNIYKDNCKEADPNATTNWVEGRATYTFVVK